jgi:hypothetical protein
MLFLDFEGFYSGVEAAGKKLSDGLVQGTLSVGKRLARFRAIFEFADLQNLAAIQAFDVLGFVILGDDLSAKMFAGGLSVCHSDSEEQSAS